MPLHFSGTNSLPQHCISLILLPHLQIMVSHPSNSGLITSLLFLIYVKLAAVPFPSIFLLLQRSMFVPPPVSSLGMLLIWRHIIYGTLHPHMYLTPIMYPFLSISILCLLHCSQELCWDLITLLCHCPGMLLAHHHLPFLPIPSPFPHSLKSKLWSMNYFLLFHLPIPLPKIQQCLILKQHHNNNNIWRKHHKK